jgi:hypothetical protein
VLPSSFPIRRFNALYHVGTLDSARKRSLSFECRVNIGETQDSDLAEQMVLRIMEWLDRHLSAATSSGMALLPHRADGQVRRTPKSNPGVGRTTHQKKSRVARIPVAIGTDRLNMFSVQ